MLEVRGQLGASRVLQDKAAEHPGTIEVRLNTTVQGFKGDGHLESVVIKDLKTDQVEELHPGAAFIFIDLDPNTAFVKGDVQLDRWGYSPWPKTCRPVWKASSLLATPVRGAPNRWPARWDKAPRRR